MSCVRRQRDHRPHRHAVSNAARFATDKALEPLRRVHRRHASARTDQSSSGSVEDRAAKARAQPGKIAVAPLSTSVARRERWPSRTRTGSRRMPADLPHRGRRHSSGRFFSISEQPASSQGSEDRTRVARSLHNGQEDRVFVTDTGIGMTPDQLARVRGIPQAMPRRAAVLAEPASDWRSPGALPDDGRRLSYQRAARLDLLVHLPLAASRSLARW